MPQGEVNQAQVYRGKKRQADQAAYGARKSEASQLYDAFQKKHNTQVSNLDAFEANTPDIIAAQRDTALAAQIAERSRIAEQAKRVQEQPIGAPTRTPNLAPLQNITGVSLNPALTGGNAATQSFFITPESSQSQFVVGAPVGGGNIGVRQKPSTGNVTPTSDPLGTYTKDQF